MAIFVILAVFSKFNFHNINLEFSSNINSILIPFIHSKVLYCKNILKYGSFSCIHKIKIHFGYNILIRKEN